MFQISSFKSSIRMKKSVSDSQVACAETFRAAASTGSLVVAVRTNKRRRHKAGKHRV